MMMMTKIDAEIEVYQFSNYCDIVVKILQIHEELSTIKLIVFSYIIKKEKFYEKPVYSARNKKNLILKSLSILAGDFDNFCNDLPYIIKTIDLLIKKEIILIDNNILKISQKGKQRNTICIESKFFQNAIEESKSMLDIQFLREVIFNV